jgi:hypothetical protein
MGFHVFETAGVIGQTHPVVGGAMRIGLTRRSRHIRAL